MSGPKLRMMLLIAAPLSTAGGLDLGALLVAGTLLWAGALLAAPPVLFELLDPEDDDPYGTQELPTH